MRVWVVVALGLSACRASRWVEEGPTEPARVSVRELPKVRWAAAPGWSLGQVRFVGDLTGDGTPDATVQANKGARAETLLVPGPLLESRTLPGDELVRFPHMAFRATGDLDGDGHDDLVLTDRAGDHVIHGPVTASSVSPGAIPSIGAYLDVNGDDVLDIAFLTEPDQNLAIVVGPHALEQEDDVDVLIDVSACVEFGRPPLRPGAVRVLPDITGDGRRELVLTPDDYATCHGPPRVHPYVGDGQVISLSPDDPVAGDWLLVAQVADDQSGDGVADVVTSGLGLEVAEGPVTLDERPPAAAFSVQVPEGAVIPQDFDLDGNGATDLLVVGGFGAAAWVALLPGGADEAAPPVYAPDGELEAQRLVTGSGRAWLPVLRGGDVWLVGLGSG